MSFKAFFESGQSGMDEEGFFTSMKDIMKFLQYNGISNFVPNAKEASIVLTNFGGSFANVTYPHLPIRITHAAEIGISDSDIENLYGLPPKLDALTLTRCPKITHLEEGPICSAAKFYDMDGFEALTIWLWATEVHIKDCKNLTNIVDTGTKCRDLRVDGCFNLESIETGAPIDRFDISNCPKFRFDGRTKIFAKNAFFGSALSFAGVAVGLPTAQYITLNGTAGYRNVLGLLEIENLKKIQVINKDDKDWTDIINKHLTDGRDIFDCQAELVEAGYEEEAEL